MKKKTIISKKILSFLKNPVYNSDSKIDLDFLQKEKYYNYCIQEYYGKDFPIKGELRKSIIDILLKKYFDWKNELDKLERDYYLAIWLYNPRLLKSEVVCAIENKIAYYNNEVFVDSKKNNEFDFDSFKSFENQLGDFSWNRKVDLDFMSEWVIDLPKNQYFSESDYYSSQRFYNKFKKNPYQIYEDNEGKVYSRQMGDIWIGKKKETYHNKP